jgi:hypothetical protein
MPSPGRLRALLAMQGHIRVGTPPLLLVPLRQVACEEIANGRIIDQEQEEIPRAQAQGHVEIARCAHLQRRKIGEPQRRQKGRPEIVSYLMQLIAGLVLLFAGLAAALLYLMPRASV